MFSEILRIKPVLDPGTAQKMEANLTRRFARVATKFGKGLQMVMKGTLLGISLGLLAKLLNPLQELEDKIKKLLGEGTDLSEMTDRFGTTPGELRKLQDVSRSIGVTPDALKDLMTKYAEAVEKAREELADTRPGAERSDTTAIVSKFTEEKDLAKSFFHFIQSLKGNANRGQIEKELFGSQQHGAARRFIEADFDREFKTLGGPDVAQLNKTFQKLAYLDDVLRLKQVQGETRDSVNAAKVLNPSVVQEIQASVDRANARENKQLASFADLQRAAQGIDELKNLLTTMSTFLTKNLGELVLMITKLTQSPMFKYFGGGK